MKNDDLLLGYVDSYGSVRAEKYRGVSHLNAFGVKLGVDTWRYIKGVVAWWEPPRVCNKHAVENYLSRHGFSFKKHIVLFENGKLNPEGYNLTHPKNEN